MLYNPYIKDDIKDLLSESCRSKNMELLLEMFCYEPYKEDFKFRADKECFMFENRVFKIGDIEIK